MESGSTVVSFRAAILLCTLSIHLNSQASDNNIIEKWTSDIASVIAQDMRSRFDQAFYENQIAGLDKDSVTQQISSDQAACIVSAYIQVAKKHSVAIEDVFVSPQKGLINTDLFPHEEINELTKDCARNAFSNAGIDYN